MVLSTGFLIASAYINGMSDSLRKKVTAVHGTTLLVLFVTGFGLMAKGNFSFSAPWVWIKIMIWLNFGLLPFFIKRELTFIKNYLFLLYSFLLVLGVYTILFKPF